MILEYIDHPTKEDSSAMRVVGHYGQSMLAPEPWFYYYRKKYQSFLIRDGAGRVIYQLDLDTENPLLLPYTLHTELSE